MAYDEFEVSDTRACIGRLYFHVPGGIKYGQHWLNVKFQKSVIRVPFRILTEDEEKTLSKNYGNIERQVKDAFKKNDHPAIAKSDSLWPCTTAPCSRLRG